MYFSKYIWKESKKIYGLKNFEKLSFFMLDFKVFYNIQNSTAYNLKRRYSVSVPCGGSSTAVGSPTGNYVSGNAHQGRQPIMFTVPLGKNTRKHLTLQRLHAEHLSFYKKGDDII